MVGSRKNPPVIPPVPLNPSEHWSNTPLGFTNIPPNEQQQLPDDPPVEEETLDNKAPATKVLDNPHQWSQSLEAKANLTLTEAIHLMTQKLRCCENPKHKAKTKAKEPDTFDSSNPKKLNFILLCSLFFCSSSTYEDDADKVNFALSYLWGTVLEYFEPTLLNSDVFLDWMDNRSTFI